MKSDFTIRIDDDGRIEGWQAGIVVLLHQRENAPDIILFARSFKAIDLGGVDLGCAGCDDGSETKQFDFLDSLTLKLLPASGMAETGRGTRVTRVTETPKAIATKRPASQFSIRAPFGRNHLGRPGRPGPFRNDDKRSRFPDSVRHVDYDNHLHGDTTLTVTAP